jgi:prepilin-type N-terminal cleavage/methylation domain-containing protein
MKHIHSQQGFTLVEAIVALFIIVLTAACAFFAFDQANQYAFVARLYTDAQIQVQNQIDLIQGDTPFVPQSSQVPPELTLGTTSQPVAVYTDYSNASNPTIVVSGNMTTTVTNITQAPLNAYQVTVSVTYTYRNHSYQVIMSTIRGSDQ